MPPQVNPTVKRELEEAHRNHKKLPRRLTDDGWTVLTLHWSVVPDYPYDIISAPLSKEACEQELELNWSASSGKNVYPEFGYSHHVATEPLKFDPRKPLYCAWDFGGNQHAFVPTQINAHGQWLIFPSLQSDEHTYTSLYEFGQVVCDHLQKYYAEPNNMSWKHLRMVHYGDPAGQGPPPRVGDSPKEMRSCFQILDKGIQVPIGTNEDGSVRYVNRPGFGFKLKPGAVNFKERVEAVKARLKLNLRGGHPALVVDPRAILIIEGFSGSYHFPQRQDGRYDLKPLKNKTSHSHDCLQYLASRIFAYLPDDEDEDEFDRPRPMEFVSHASSRYER